MGFRRSLVRIQSPRHRKASRDKQFRLAFFHYYPPRRVPYLPRKREAAGAEGVEEVLVLAAEFEALQAGAVAQGVVGEGEDVVGPVVGQVDLEDVQAVI